MKIDQNGLFVITSDDLAALPQYTQDALKLWSQSPDVRLSAVLNDTLDAVRSSKKSLDADRFIKSKSPEEVAALADSVTTPEDAIPK